MVLVNSNEIERGERFKFKEIENDIKAFYDFINCNYIDIATRKIGNTYFDFIVDDNFLLKVEDKEELKPSVAVVDCFGNIIIASHDEDGNTTGLSLEEGLKIFNSISRIFDNEGNKYLVIKANY